MPADNRNQELRSVLAEKSTKELEKLLALDFTEEDVEPDVDFITTVLEVIEEREGNKQQEAEAAWKDFQEYYRLRKQEELESGTTVESSHDHHRKTEYRQRPRRASHMLRYSLIAAAAVVLLCGNAFGWNIFQAIANWTEDTFYFLTGRDRDESIDQDVFEHLRKSVALKTDVAAVPKWYPSGTEEIEMANVIDRKDRQTIQATFSSAGREFTIRITIHDSLPDDYSGSFQKDTDIVAEHKAGGVIHYITGNNETVNVMWTNGCIAGLIQGFLTLDEVQMMIDSIYEE